MKRTCKNGADCANPNGPELTEEDFYKRTGGGYFCDCRVCHSKRVAEKQRAFNSKNRIGMIEYFKGVAQGKRLMSVCKAYKRADIDGKDVAEIEREVNFVAQCHKEPAHVESAIPTLKTVLPKRRKGLEMSSIELFIFNHQPRNKESARKFRKLLRKVMREG